MIHCPKLLRTVAMALALSIGATSCAAAPQKHIQQDASGRIIPNVGDIKMSPEQQVELGRQAAAEAEKQLPILPESSPVTKEIQRLGQKLAAKAPGQKWPYVFKVVNQKEINAFALPGGPIYVNLGTIQQADESELAGVMAHEIAHVVMQHSARSMGKQQGMQILGALGTVLAGAVLGGGMAGQLAQLGIQIGATGVVMKYSREAETEADLVGSQIMYDAGFDPYAMVEFFQTLEKQSGGSGGPQFLSDHPNPGNRAKTVAQAIQKFPKKNFPRSDSSTYVAMKRTASGLKPLSAQEIAQQQKAGGASGQSLDPGQIAPSGNFRDLNQGNFTIKYPDNWSVFGDQQSGLVIAPRAGVGENAIAYGVSINQAQSQRGGSLSMDQMTADVIQTLQQTNQDLRAAGNPQRITVNGRQGRSVDLLGTSPVTANGQAVRERDWLVTVQTSNNAVMVLVFTAPEPDFSKLRPTFENMLRSLQVQ